MKLRSGITLISKIEGSRAPIGNKGRYDAFLKFYRNRGEALEMPTSPVEPVPYVAVIDGKDTIAWEDPAIVKSNVVIERNRTLSRETDLLPGIYYSILGMKAGGYRHVSIPPHLFAHLTYEFLGIEKESVVKLEIFLTSIR